MSNCIFCNVEEDKLLLNTLEGFVILDYPVCPGHVLVGSRTHGSTLSDISEDDAAALMRLSHKVAKKIVSETGAEKVYIAAIGDKDKHFHIHLLPKMESDPNLGPYIFGNEGWVSFMDTEIDPVKLEKTNNAIRKLDI